MQDAAPAGSAVAFALIYLTFFLDNVLLTVLVPIIPDWIRGESVALWAERDAPLAGLLNHTVHRITHEHHDANGIRSGGSQAVVGLVLGAKAAAQLVTAPLAGAAVSRRGAAPVLRAATAALALAALGNQCKQITSLMSPVRRSVVAWMDDRGQYNLMSSGGAGLSVCSGCAGAAAALCVGGARATHGAGAALGGVAGLALAARALPAHSRHRGIGALLGAVALGVLVGYPFGGATYALWSRGAPFLFLAAALLADLGMALAAYPFAFCCHYESLRDVEKHTSLICPSSLQPLSDGYVDGPVSPVGMLEVAQRGATAACAGCVLLTTCVMAALEPCLPLWLEKKFHPARWQTGVVFVPDSVGYLLAASGGGLARRIGAERVALTGQVSSSSNLNDRAVCVQVAVGAAALSVPLARSVVGLALPHLVLGLGLGAADAALVPALLARGGRRAPALAALLQAASAAAYALGPVLGGLLAAAAGFEAALRTAAALNLLYAAYLYTRLCAYPISEQWGASSDGALDSDDDTSDDIPHTEMTPLAPLAQLKSAQYKPHE
ncbi:unnamed protein product [Arctia plantaginis]|uniref:Uncharacterized protein n=1 Tax=Arctia plantaginis TaxID=874455 RepID=A0A8S0YYN5_ARCPL|nr:unnamed protein product [Arctia plantaginis]